MKRRRMDRPIQVALVEDNDDLRSTLSSMISGSPGFACVGAFPDGETALAQLPAVQPDVVLMDINLPQMSGIECLAKLKQQLPALPVLMLTVYDDSDQVFRSLMAGATGYLVKRTPKDKLLEAIRELDEGGAPMSRQIARRVVQYFQKMKQAPAPSQTGDEMQSLTTREQDILAHLAKGHAYKEIADLLHISVDTVRSHVRSIYEKLHVHSRTEAVLKFLAK